MDGLLLPGGQLTGKHTQTWDSYSMRHDHRPDRHVWQLFCHIVLPFHNGFSPVENIDNRKEYRCWCNKNPIDATHPVISTDAWARISQEVTVPRYSTCNKAFQDQGAPAARHSISMSVIQSVVIRDRINWILSRACSIQSVWSVQFHQENGTEWRMQLRTNLQGKLK